MAAPALAYYTSARGLLAGAVRRGTRFVFPAWLVCFIVAIVLTALARLALLRLRVKAALPLLVYPSLAALFTFVLWLIFFY